MNVLFWERRDFHVSFSGRDISENVWKSSLGNFYGRYGDHIKHYEVSISQMLHNILGYGQIQWRPSIDQTFHYIVTLLLNWTLLLFFDVITKFREVQ